MYNNAQFQYIPSNPKGPPPLQQLPPFQTQHPMTMLPSNLQFPSHLGPLPHHLRSTPLQPQHTHSLLPQNVMHFQQHILPSPPQQHLSAPPIPYSFQNQSQPLVPLPSHLNRAIDAFPQNPIATPAPTLYQVPHIHSLPPQNTSTVPLFPREEPVSSQPKPSPVIVWLEGFVDRWVPKYSGEGQSTGDALEQRLSRAPVPAAHLALSLYKQLKYQRNHLTALVRVDVQGESEKTSHDVQSINHLQMLLDGALSLMKHQMDDYRKKRARKKRYRQRKKANAMEMKETETERQKEAHIVADQWVKGMQEKAIELNRANECKRVCKIRRTYVGRIYKELEVWDSLLDLLLQLRSARQMQALKSALHSGQMSNTPNNDDDFLVKLQHAQGLLGRAQELTQSELKRLKEESVTTGNDNIVKDGKMSKDEEMETIVEVKDVLPGGKFGIEHESSLNHDVGEVGVGDLNEEEMDEHHKYWLQATLSTTALSNVRSEWERYRVNNSEPGTLMPTEPANFTVPEHPSWSNTLQESIL